MEGEPDLAFGEVGVLYLAVCWAVADEDVVVHLDANGFGGILVGVGTADGRTAGFLHPDVECGLELFFETRVGATPLGCAEDGFFAADSYEYAHECQRVRL